MSQSVVAAGQLATRNDLGPGGRIHQVDALRGVAVIMVVVLHYYEGIVPSWLISRFLLLTSGVDLFFVLSGFLIGGILLDAKRSSNFFATFYVRRFCRIAPPYLILIALYLVAMILPWTQDLATFHGRYPWWSYPTFTQNFFIAARNSSDYDNDWMAATWSFAVEEQFYLLFPLLVRFASRRTTTLVIAGAIVAAPLIRTALLFSYIGGAHVLLPCRADGLGIGVLIAIAIRNRDAWDWLKRHQLCIYGCAALSAAISLVYVSQLSVWTFGATAYALFYGSVLVLLLMEPNSTVTVQISRTPFLLGAATISYFVYLFHFGIFSMIHALVSSSGGMRILLTQAATVITIALAFGSWKWIERPLIERARRQHRYSAPQLSSTQGRETLS